MRYRLRHELGDVILTSLQVEAELGSGAYGTVYRCLDLASGAERAVKELHVLGDPLDREQALGFFRREAHHLSHLDHPNIPRAEAVDLTGPFRIDSATGIETPHGDIEVAERHYLVMEWVPGLPLEALVVAARADGTPLAAERVLAWAGQIASALEAIHGAGLVHRDVKPANILIRESDDAAVLIDFGLCREACSVPGYGTVPLSESGRLGTPGYAPPDPVEQENPVPASDQHALGMTIRRALTGLDPTDPEDLAKLRDMRLGELRGDLVPHVQMALDRAIRSAPEERHPSMAALIGALEAPPAPVAAPPRATWIVIRPGILDFGTVGPGQHRELGLTIRDRRSGLRPQGIAESGDDRLRILPSTHQGTDAVLTFLLRIPTKAEAENVETQVEIRANGEQHLVPVYFTIDPSAPRHRAGGMGCALMPLSWLGIGRG